MDDCRGGSCYNPPPRGTVVAGSRRSTKEKIHMHRSSNPHRVLILTAIGAGALALAGSLASPTPARAAADEAGAKFFESKIRPILAQNCVGCHGEEKQKGDLRLDTRENLLKGGKDGDKVIKVVEPGNPEKSMIVEAIEYKN